MYIWYKTQQLTYTKRLIKFFMLAMGKLDECLSTFHSVHYKHPTYSVGVLVSGC